MNRTYKFLLSITLIAIFSIVVAEEEGAYKIQAAPELLKHFIGLEGEWTGTHVDHDGKEQQMKLAYRAVSGGTAVEERIFADTPKEMITVYHGDGGDKLLMTHYCALGNQPRLRLDQSDGSTFEFHYLDGAGIDRETTGHMGGMKMTIVDENTIQHEWAYYEGGEVKNVSKFTFTRN